MAKEKREYYTSYQPQQHQSRFWVHSESCYTEEELEQRTWILKTRSNSGIHPDYLSNPSSWFADDSQALINTYERSWFYSNSFKPRHVLTRDDFHVQPIDSQRLQWSALYDLMQKTGDYLLLRNQALPQNHLNQPMNFFLLDLNHILKGISQNSNIKQTRDQLEHVTRYVRTIEKNISPFAGSDRLFLANFRGTIEDEIHPQLTHRIESQLLRDRLSELSKTIEQLSTERNRILHFALNTNQVNPHPYTFAIDKPADLKAYPTQAVKECGKISTAVVESPVSVLQLTGKELKDCPDFQLINMQDKVLDHYAKAITDLNELNQFQKVITQTMDLLGQAGEVYTVFQFKEQLSLLLKQIEHFIDESSSHIEEIIHANTLAYHKAIHEEQNLSFLKKWLTSEQEKLNTFIGNQDTLAQFPSTAAELAKTNQVLKQQVNYVIGHLNGPKVKSTDFATLAEQAQELNVLMESMHRWITFQYTLKGLAPPKEPEKLELLPQPRSRQKAHQPSKLRPSFFESNKSPSGTGDCLPNWTYEPAVCPVLPEQPQAIAVCSDQDMAVCRAPEQETSYAGIYLGLIVLIPVGLLALYLVYQALNKPEPKVKTLGNKDEYEGIKTQLDDFIVTIQRDERMSDSEIKCLFEVYIERYDELNKQAQKEIYDMGELRELYEDIKCFYDDYAPKSPTSLTC
ncbi:hypothetical protein LEAN103870_00730 [Legionella anisa]|uniref:Uncharacterized protein n=1 Tax=Legionella anisa TaxID=28082 RepID=A0AAX0WVM9_9GAMM|nr:hypothetical protein [Legionella anisa]AWN73890.1 hypothetical protein DLD14_08620 [Legionella anisa]KTC67158.1 hypothetical protein Lani_3503 [Legionella anisa]MBN5937296.1 hypothetical protein [Legionella anisa]PNL62205.1 hypothetical protein A6J39_013805 [Legionella anisa]UAK79054.1 hypothetical protein K8O89_15645 [Legionella anisa]